jgi:uncharacterized cysteine cluster protein YcgN (CxxCxxCC family)
MDFGLLIGLFVFAFLGASGYLAYRVTKYYRRLRGKRLVNCPETGKTAAVELDAKAAVKESLWSTPALHLSECSRWPERKGCGQACLRQIELAPENCLVRNIIVQWYDKKTCVLCGHTVEAAEQSIGHTPALQDPQGKTVYWDEVTPEKLPEILETHKPVCWSCHISEKFRREHAEMVVDRPVRW